MEQSLIHALFHVIDLGGDKARDKAEMLGAIILSNRLQALSTQEDVAYVETLITGLRQQIETDLQSNSMKNRETHEELIHAYVSLSKAVEYAKMTMKSR